MTLMDLPMMVVEVRLVAGAYYHCWRGKNAANLPNRCQCAGQSATFCAPLHRSTAAMSHVRSAAVAPIKQADVIASVTDALQYISYYHSPDFVRAMAAAYEKEQGPAAKDAIKQILVNSRMCAEGHRPICQDTGIVTVFCKVGMSIRWADATMTLDEMVNDGVRRAYNWPDNRLRPSIVDPPAFERRNTRDNTPAVIHTEIVPGDTLEIAVAAKGGGSENKAILGMLNPSDSIVDFVCEMIPEMGAGWCPPGLLGIGIGGTAEKAMLLAKEALLEPIDIAAVRARGAANNVEKLRLEILDRVNALGVGAQGLGGLTTVLDIKIRQYPTHAASLPVGIIPNCAATRHIHFVLDGSGPAAFDPPDLNVWPKLTYEALPDSRRVNLDTLTRAEVASFKPGERLLLSGKMLTGRDAAHKRIAALLEAGKPLPAGLDFHDRVIYYVGPVDPVGNEAVGPAGPTTATRMDKFTETMLGKAGLIAMIGKAERGPEAIEVIKRYKAAYLMAVGGSAYLVSKAIKSSRVVAFADLGMEAVYEFEVKDMPVTVAVDSKGESVHTTGPALWKAKIAGVPVAVE
jgi:fumarate hydratase, class I